MVEKNEKVVGYCTVPSLDLGKKIAYALVEKGLAACVNIVPSLTSIYKWKGKIEEDHEELLIIKSTVSLTDKIIEEIKKIHTYETPEIIFVSIIKGEKEYLRWIDESVEK